MIKIIRDDIGVLSLIRQNAVTPDGSENVEEVEPYPTIRHMEPRPQKSPPRKRDRRRHSAQLERQQRGTDRRQQQRRQQNATIVLNTRSSYERRQQLRRNTDLRLHHTHKNHKPNTGFDQFA